MFKYLFVLLFSVPLLAKVNSQVSQEKLVFKCESSTQTFEIKKSFRGQRLQGTLFAHENQDTMRCEERDFGYLCKKNDQIVKVMRGISGRKIVQFELEGDFGIESGYLYTMCCR